MVRLPPTKENEKTFRDNFPKEIAAFQGLKII
jgi:hypothetical protein